MEESEKTINALLKQGMKNLEEKLDAIACKVDKLLSKEDAASIYATKLELEKLRSKVNWYSWIMPITTFVIGYLINSFLK